MLVFHNQIMFSTISYHIKTSRQSITGKNAEDIEVDIRYPVLHSTSTWINQLMDNLTCWHVAKLPAARSERNEVKR